MTSQRHPAVAVRRGAQVPLTVPREEPAKSPRASLAIPRAAREPNCGNDTRNEPRRRNRPHPPWGDPHDPRRRGRWRDEGHRRRPDRTVHRSSLGALEQDQVVTIAFRTPKKPVGAPDAITMSSPAVAGVSAGPTRPPVREHDAIVTRILAPPESVLFRLTWRWRVSSPFRGGALSPCGGVKALGRVSLGWGSREWLAWGARGGAGVVRQRQSGRRRSRQTGAGPVLAPPDGYRLVCAGQIRSVGGPTTARAPP